VIAERESLTDQSDADCNFIGQALDDTFKLHGEETVADFPDRLKSDGDIWSVIHRDPLNNVGRTIRFVTHLLGIME
jgi:hypothetical protein